MMFRRDEAQKIAQEAKDMAIAVSRDHQNHVAVCLEGQRRIEGRFGGIDAKLDKQDREFDLFKDDQNKRLDAIKENDTRRYVAMMGVMLTTVMGIGVQIVFHYWK